MKNERWHNKSYSFFTNKSCECFPCHTLDENEEFSCLFCYCPLYALGEDCGGNPVYTEKGIKNCCNCLFPHRKENYGLVTKKLKVIIEQVRKKG